MRTIFKKISVMILAVVLGLGNAVFSTALAEGNEGFTYVVSPVKSKSQIVFGYENQNVEKVIVKIKDQSGNVLYIDVFKTKNASKLYDLSEIGAGKYEVEVKAGSFVESKQIVLETRVPGTVFKAEVSPVAETNKFKIEFANNLSDEIYIYINDEEGNNIYSESTILKNYQRVFDFGKSPVGNYTITIAHPRETLSQVFKVTK